MPDRPQIYMAFDYGKSYLGVAVGNSFLQEANPLQQLKNVSAHQANWPAIYSLIREWGPHALVVGIPLNEQHPDQTMTEKARIFAKQLRDQTGLVVHELDEHLTSCAARSLLGQGYKKAQVDSLAAALILRDFLQQNARR
jgi:putative Holliday junction resolvase